MRALKRGRNDDIESRLRSKSWSIRKDIADLFVEDRFALVRIYRMYSDGLKLKFLKQMSIHDAADYQRTVVGGIEGFIMHYFGDGHYCVKLISTKCGRNILEARYELLLGDTSDEDW